MFYQSMKDTKKRVLLFCACKIYISKQMKEPKLCITLCFDKTLQSFENTREKYKNSHAALVFYISLVFSNDHRVLSQCNTRLRLLYLLSITSKQQIHSTTKISIFTLSESLVDIIKYRLSINNFKKRYKNHLLKCQS